MLHPGQREPTEAEIKKTGRDTGTASRDQWRYDMPYCPVGVFLPRDISDFLWERDEEAYPGIWDLQRIVKRDMGAL